MKKIVISHPKGRRYFRRTCHRLTRKNSTQMRPLLQESRQRCKRLIRFVSVQKFLKARSPWPMPRMPAMTTCLRATINLDGYKFPFTPFKKDSFYQVNDIFLFHCFTSPTFNFTFPTKQMPINDHRVIDSHL